MNSFNSIKKKKKEVPLINIGKHSLHKDGKLECQVLDNIIAVSELRLRYTQQMYSYSVYEA